MMDHSGSAIEEVRTEVTHAGHRGRFGPEQGIFRATLTRQIPHDAVIIVRHHVQEHDQAK